MTNLEIPARLIKGIVFLYGEEHAQTLLASLPRRIRLYAGRWNLHVHGMAEGGAMSCCVYCTTPEGIPAVLKIPLDKASGRSEIRQLERLHSSAAAPRVLRSATNSGVFLMSRIHPGTTAWASNGADDSHKYGDLLRRLKISALPLGLRLRDMAQVAKMRLDWARQHFADGDYTDDLASIEEAERVLDVLLRTTTSKDVLHADLQAKNVLQGPDGWYAIDPLGAIGDFNAEAALWVAVQDGPTSTEARLTELRDHELLDPDRLLAWTYVFSVSEFRPTMPPSAYRIEDFLRQANPDAIINQITHATCMA
ncbi:aminoglycoside phosphotransferase family protein [Microtetraspora malaysiensis]|uniref:aminoglycoside phosphotransferase family protein n=1 Tax=Microtetraspora malaysiensis TaxID=161358 RepID=UPI003D8BF009